MYSTVFPPERAIAGIPCYNQRWPSEKQKKGQFGLFLLEDYGLNTGIIILKAIPGLEIVINTVASATSISSLATKNSGLVAIIRHNSDYISLC